MFRFRDTTKKDDAIIDMGKQQQISTLGIRGSGKSKSNERIITPHTNRRTPLISLRLALKAMADRTTAIPSSPPREKVRITEITQQTNATRKMKCSKRFCSTRARKNNIGSAMFTARAATPLLCTNPVIGYSPTRSTPAQSSDQDGRRL